MPSTSDKPQKPAGYEGNWMQVAWNATAKAAERRMQGQLIDGSMLQYAAELQAQVGGTSVKIHVSASINGHPPGSYTLATLNKWVVSAANAGGSAAAYKVQAAQSEFSRAQTMVNQWVTDAQGFVSSENNTATSADPQNVAQANQVLSTEANFEQQMSQLHISC